MLQSQLPDRTFSSFYSFESHVLILQDGVSMIHCFAVMLAKFLYYFTIFGDQTLPFCSKITAAAKMILMAAL